MEQNFKADLDKLIALFKKLREKNIFETMIKDKEQIKNLDMVINNYDMIKDNIPDEVVKALGEPIKKLILMLTEELKDEIGNLDEIDNFDEIENMDNAIKLTDNNDNELEIIDKILREGDLTNEEINNLLDRRNEIKK